MILPLSGARTGTYLANAANRRYDECTKRLALFLKGNGFNPKTDLFFIPISAYKGHNLKDRVDKKVCPWWDGPSLLEYLDSMQSLERKVKSALMMPIGGKFKVYLSGVLVKI
jgi:peptide chain release factor subunit 3